ncbi:CLUMA_CG005275, isoform A [Clunio marinus]|uniref:CLUMA_CG005275, isoform A n=1 Tax=Clunio marinus TaxID=568069 RepID=A0A1J1HUD7_9DIPT|nr:CLUMA_CG005275, isoform A [Clunio marinus]
MLKSLFKSTAIINHKSNKTLLNNKQFLRYHVVRSGKFPKRPSQYFAAFSSSLSVQTNSQLVCIRITGQPLSRDKSKHYSCFPSRIVRYHAMPHASLLLKEKEAMKATQP